MGRGGEREVLWSRADVCFDASVHFHGMILSVCPPAPPLWRCGNPFFTPSPCRYYVGEGWVPKKLDVLVDMPDHIDLEALRGGGPQAGEQLQPEGEQGSGAGAGAALAVPDEALVAELVGMGFGENGCRRAAVATKNAGMEAAMEWVLGHMEDADFNDPMPSAGAAAAAGGAKAADPEQVSMLEGMGFSEEQAKAALMVRELQAGEGVQGGRVLP